MGGRHSFVHSFIYSFVYPFNKYLLSTLYVPGSVLGARGPAGREMGRVREKVFGILNRLVRKGLPEKVKLGESDKGEEGQTIQLSGGGMLQGEVTARAKVLRQECGWHI